MFSILIEPQGLLRTLGKLELQSSERKVMAGLILTIILIVCWRISHAVPLRNIDAGYTGCTRDIQNLIRSDSACAVNSGAVHSSNI